LLDEKFDVLPLKLSRLVGVPGQAVEIGTLDGILSCLKALKTPVPHGRRIADSFPNVYRFEHWIASIATNFGAKLKL
jgi:hypothetical protein